MTLDKIKQLYRGQTYDHGANTSMHCALCISRVDSPVFLFDYMNKLGVEMLLFPQDVV